MSSCARLGKAIDPEYILRALEVLEGVLDAVPCQDVTEIVEEIELLKKEVTDADGRAKTAETEKEEADEEHIREVDKLTDAYEAQKKDIAQTADEWRARAEKAEYALSQAGAMLVAMRAEKPVKRRPGPAKAKP